MLQYKGSESAKNPYYAYAHSNLGYFLKPHKSKAAGYKDLLYMLLHTYVNMLFWRELNIPQTTVLNYPLRLQK